MSTWQQDQLIADVVPREIVPEGQSRLTVYMSRWPGYPGGRAPQVMWLQGDTFHYLPPAVARRFAAALIKAADEAEAPS